jgi:hypothetical protein
MSSEYGVTYLSGSTALARLPVGEVFRPPRGSRRDSARIPLQATALLSPLLFDATPTAKAITLQQ